MAGSVALNEGDCDSSGWLCGVLDLPSFNGTTPREILSVSKPKEGIQCHVERKTSPSRSSPSYVKMKENVRFSSGRRIAVGK